MLIRQADLEEILSALNRLRINGTGVVGLESGSATGFICAQGEIARINFSATVQETPVGDGIHVTLDLVNETGTLMTDDGRRKRLNVVIEGVGQGRCTTELEIVSDRPGESPVSVSLGRIGPEQRSLRFFLELNLPVFLAVAVGGLLGGFARAVSIWKRVLPAGKSKA